MTPRDPLSSWFDDPEPRDDATLPDDDGAMPAIVPDAGPRRRLVVVGLLAVVVWATAAALSLAGDGTAMQAAAPTSASPTPSATTGTPVSVPSPAGPASAPAGGDGVDILPAGVPAAAEAVAEVTVHELVTGKGDDRWVDAAALEGWVPVTDGPGSDLVAVAVVRTMLLEAGPKGWERRRQARYAVAVRCEDDECRSASQVWPLPLDETVGPSDAPVAGGAVDGHTGALLAAGYVDPAVEVLSEPLPGVVEVEVVAVPPGGVAAETHRVWLHTSPSPAVIGADSPSDRSSPDLRR